MRTSHRKPIFHPMLEVRLGVRSDGNPKLLVLASPCWQVGEGIDGLSVGANLEMAMIGGGSTAAPDSSDHVSLTHFLALPDQQFAVMGVQGAQTLAMIQDDGLSVSPQSSAAIDDPAGSGGDDILAAGPADVDSLVMPVAPGGTES